MMASWMSSLRTNLIYQAALLAEELRTFEPEFRTLYNAAITMKLREVQRIEGLQGTDFERIKPSLHDAARASISDGWLSVFWDTCTSRKRVLALMGLAAILVPTSILTIMALTLPTPSSRMPGGYVFASLALALLIIAIRQVIHGWIHYKLSTVLLVMETALAITSLATFDKWDRYLGKQWPETVHALVPVKFAAKLHLMTVPAAEVSLLAIWAIASICIFFLIGKFVNFQGMMYASQRNLGYSRVEMANAQLVISLFSISHAADLLCRELGIGTASRPLRLPSDIDRYQLGWLFEQATSHVKKPWATTMARNNGAAGRWIAAQAPRIAFYLQYQKSRNILFGSNLEELRDSMTAAAIQAIDGKWHLIGAGDSKFAATVKVYRWKSIIRRTLAIALPCVAALIVANFMPYLSSQYRNLIIFTCIGYAGVQVLTLIDPEFSGRLDTASKIMASVIKRN